MTKFEEDVTQFLIACDHKIGKEYSIDRDQVQLYMNLLVEEFLELLTSFNLHNEEDFLDAVGDCLWVLIGLSLSSGAPLNDLWEEIKTSNFSKVIDGKVIKNRKGKIMKPSSFRKPDIAKILCRKS